MKIKALKNVIDRNFTLILTSNSNEKNLVNSLFDCHTKIDINSKISGRIGLIKNKFVLHISGGLGISANNAIGKYAILFLSSDEFPKPQLTILAGVCWGNPKVTNIGDVIISNSILSSNLKKNNKTPENLVPIKSLFTFQHQDDNDFKTFSNALLLSEENRIEDSNFRNLILETSPNIYGGEMEGFSFLSHDFNWLIVKVVADHGEKLNKSIQEEKIKNIEPIIKSIIEKNNEEEIHNEKFIELKSYLNSLNLHIEMQETDTDEKKLIITKKYLSLIGSNLLNYHSEDPNFNNFKFNLRSLILEILYNSFIHGNAKKVDIKFNKNEIKITEDGTKFNLEQLNSIQKKSGGSSVFLELEKHKIFQKYNYESTKRYNIHRFCFTDKIKNLKEIKMKCELYESDLINKITFQEALNIDQTCSAFYLDARGLPTQSFNPIIFNCCLILIEKTEKNVFLKLDGDAHKNMLLSWNGIEKYHKVLHKIIFLT